MNFYMKIRIRYAILSFSVFFLFAMCSREGGREDGMSNTEDAPLVDMWSTSEKAPLLRLLVLYDNDRFLLVEGSDVGGRVQYHGAYRKDDNEIYISPDGSSGAHGEFFSIHKGKKGVEYLVSSVHKNISMYKCVELDQISDWGVYIQNNQDFHERVKNAHKDK